MAEGRQAYRRLESWVRQLVAADLPDHAVLRICIFERLLEDAVELRRHRQAHGSHQFWDHGHA